jgi:hypothetical protein
MDPYGHMMMNPMAGPSQGNFMMNPQSMHNNQGMNNMYMRQFPKNVPSFDNNPYSQFPNMYGQPPQMMNYNGGFGNMNNNNNNQNIKENKLFSPEKDRNIPNNDTSTINATYISNKISPLTQITFCYYRLFSNTNQKFNPLSSIPINQITNPPFNFIKGTICLSKNHKVVHISPSISLTQPIEINVEDINNTIVNSTIKKVIEIHREYRKEKMNKVFDIEVFPDKEIFKNMKLSRDDIIKSALNKNFNFSIMVNHTKRYEFILNNYDDFKMWINGVAFLLKYNNNNQIN